MADTLKASEQGLKIVDQARRRKRWQKYALTWATVAATSTATLKRFWSRRSIDRYAFIAICQAVGVDWKEVAELTEIQETELPVVSAPKATPSVQNLNFVGSEKAIAANNRGFDCYINGDLTQANKQFELALKINPDHDASYYNQAWSYEQVGDFDRAIELNRQAALQGFAAAYSNLARLHIIEEKKYDLAVNICGRGLALVQEDNVETDKIVKAALLTYLAWAWINQGRDEDALEKLQEALELQEDRALTHALMAQALDNLGQPTEALEAWKNYINKYPHSDCRDKDVWMVKARQRLRELSGTYPINDNLD